MIQRPIGEAHGEQCDSGDYEWLCDDCRAGANSEEPADELLDLIERLKLAETQLEAKRNHRGSAGFTDEATRLSGKASGVRLALSYAEETLRMRGRS